jgi:transposase-like protein
MPHTTPRPPKAEPFWRELIARWKTPGQSVADFCAAHDVGQASFYAWRQRLSRRKRGESSTASPHPTFAAVRVVSDPIAEVLLPTGLTVRVPVNADPAAVVRSGAATSRPEDLSRRVWEV